VRRDLDGTIRVADESSPAMMWLAASLVAGLLAAVLYLVTMLRR
jgi:hypothetical protein